jgi:adenylate cyclase
MASTRHLAAILAADIAGYSRRMGADEEGTLNRLKALRADLIDPKSPRVTAGWSKPQATVSSSSSAASSTRWSLCYRGTGGHCGAKRTGPREQTASVSTWVTSRSSQRGSGALAGPGGICVSARVQEDARGKLGLAFRDPQILEATYFAGLRKAGMPDDEIGEEGEPS